MANPRTMLRRIRRLERGRDFHLARWFGSIEEFEAQVRAGIEAGVYDSVDMPTVASAVKRWWESDAL